MIGSMHRPVSSRQRVSELARRLSTPSIHLSRDCRHWRHPNPSRPVCTSIIRRITGSGLTALQPDIVAVSCLSGILGGSRVLRGFCPGRSCSRSHSHGGAFLIALRSMRFRQACQTLRPFGLHIRSAVPPSSFLPCPQQLRGQDHDADGLVDTKAYS